MKLELQEFGYLKIFPVEPPGDNEKIDIWDSKIIDS